jgi:two-component system, NarL family, nitrate/nitrite response regulator NarL
VLKGVSAQELAKVVRTAAKGEVYVSPDLASEILETFMKSRSPDALQELSDREGEILRLIGTGLTNREIAVQMALSERTVERQVSNILHKLQVRSRVEAALFAVKHVKAK